MQSGWVRFFNHPRGILIQFCGCAFYIRVKFIQLSNGNRTEWSPIQSVIIRVITKSDDRAAGVRFVYYEYDYRLNWTTRSPIIN